MCIFVNFSCAIHSIIYILVHRLDLQFAIGDNLISLITHCKVCSSYPFLTRTMKQDKHLTLNFISICKLLISLKISLIFFACFFFSGDVGRGYKYPAVTSSNHRPSCALCEKYLRLSGCSNSWSVLSHFLLRICVFLLQDVDVRLGAGAGSRQCACRRLPIYRGLCEQAPTNSMNWKSECQESPALTRSCVGC